MGEVAGVDERRAEGEVWILFAAVILMVNGAFNLLYGLVAITKDSYLDKHVLFSSVTTWGVVVVILGIVAIIAAIAVFMKQPWSRWLGVGVCAVDAVVQLGFLRAFPFWSALIIAIDILVIYGLVVYGGREGVWVYEGA
jgi:hypothetical protein